MKTAKFSGVKRIITMLLAVCIMAGMMPVNVGYAAAADEDVAHTLKYYFYGIISNNEAIVRPASTNNEEIASFTRSEETASTSYPWRTNEGEWSIYLNEATSSANAALGTATVTGRENGFHLSTYTGAYCTLRIKVDKPGWYTPTVEIHNYAANYGGIMRTYIAPVDKDASTITSTELATLRNSKNSIGVIDCYATTAGGKVSRKMRTMYFENAGEYAVVFLGESRVENSSGPHMTPRSLTLERVALVDTSATEALPDMQLDSIIPTDEREIQANGSAEFAMMPTMSDGSYEDLVSVDASAITVETSDATKLTATVTADTYGYKTLKLTAGDYVCDDATVTISVTRDGKTHTSNPIAINITDSDTATYQLNCDFTQGAAVSPFTGTDRRKAVYSVNGDTVWSTNSEHSSYLADREDSTKHNTYIRLNGSGTAAALTTQGGNINQNNWLTIRLNVKRPGWYKTTVGYNQGTYGSPVGRVFLAPVSKMAGTLTENELTALRSDEYSIGNVNFYADSANNGLTKNLRTVYIPEAGEYALTVMAETRVRNAYAHMMLKSFTLDRVAFADAEASAVLPSDMALGSIVPEESRTLMAGAAATFELDATVAANDDLVGATISVKSSNEDVLTVGTESRKVGAEKHDSRMKNLVLTAVKGGTATVTVTAVREGVTYTADIPITVVGDDFGENYVYAKKGADGGWTVATIAGIKSTDYRSVGFEYKVDDGAVQDSGAITNVYATIKVDNSEITKDIIGKPAEYLFYNEFKIASGSKVSFRAYAVDMSGNTIYGDWTDDIAMAE